VDDWSVTLAQVLRTSVAEVERYVILKNSRYRLNEALLSDTTRQHIRQVCVSLCPGSTASCVHRPAWQLPALSHSLGVSGGWWVGEGLGRSKSGWRR
jgi:hypothetical protein